MQFVKIATGEPINLAQIEANWIAAQPAKVEVPETVIAVDEDGEETTETVMVEIDNHVDAPLPDDLTGVDWSDYGVAAVEPVPAPATDIGEMVEPAAPEEYEPGKWRQAWTVRPMTADEKKALVPQSITRRQARLVLSRHGYLATVETAIAQMQGQAGEEARIEWADASVFNREHPLIAVLGTLLGLTSDQIDALYIEGGAI